MKRIIIPKKASIDEFSRDCEAEPVFNQLPRLTRPSSFYLVPLDLRQSVGMRVIAGAVGMACTGILLLAAYLSPDPRGLGTHEPLGIGPCLIPITTGYPCPTCGMTTAFAYAVRGRWISSFDAQPAGLILATVITLVGILGMLGAIRGRTWRPDPSVLSTNRLAVMAVAVCLLGWSYKVASGRLAGTLPLW